MRFLFRLDLSLNAGAGNFFWNFYFGTKRGLVPWALLTTRTTVNGPTVSVSCPVLLCLCVQFYVLELASWKLLQPEWGRGHFFSVINIDNKRLHEAIAFQLIIHKRALKKF